MSFFLGGWLKDDVRFGSEADLMVDERACPLRAKSGNMRFSCIQRPSCALLDSEKMSQAAMNMAAITGPMTKPLSPKVARPPSVEISTT